MDIAVFEYDSCRTRLMVACDLVIYTRAGEVYMHDFLLLKEGNWRNSFGEVAATFTAFIPTIVLTAKLIKREKIAKFSVRGSNV